MLYLLNMHMTHCVVHRVLYTLYLLVYSTYIMMCSCASGLPHRRGSVERASCPSRAGCQSVAAPARTPWPLLSIAECRGGHPKSSRLAFSQGRCAMAEKRYRRLDEGELLGALATGTYGRVYAAWDTQTGATVAVKRQEVPCDVAAQELCVLMALRQDEHPNVLRLLDHFTVSQGRGQAKQTMLYLVFEFMDSTLWTLWVRRRRLFPMDVSVELIRQMVAGVAHLHSAGVVHTDISMGNLLVNQGTRLKVADLGCAVDASSLVLRPGDTLTTLATRAPELLLGALQVGAAVDLWSVGVVAMSLLAGTLLFWRSARVEKPIDGLWAPEARIPGFEPSDTGHWKETSAMAVYANQVAFLGPPPVSEWPEAMGWPGFEPSRHLPGPLRGTTDAFLEDPDLLRRPLTPAGREFVLGLLRWIPQSRLPAADCLMAALFLERPCAPEPAAQALVSRLDIEELRALVLHSVSTGMPISLEPETMASKRPRAEGVVVSQAPPKAESGGAASSQERHPERAPAASDQGNEPGSAGNAVQPAVPPSVAAAEAVAPAPPRMRCRRKTKEAKEALSQDAPEDLALPAAPESSEHSGPPAVALSQASAEERGCECRGNCGQRGCLRNKNRRRSGFRGPLCGRPPLPGESYCGFCKCELCGSGRQAFHGGGRWCTTCYHECEKASSQAVYFNQYGKHRVDKDWGWELEMTAKFSYATRLAPGADAVAWDRFLADFMRMRGATEWPAIQDPGDWMFLVVVASIKWPPLVDQTIALLEGFEPRNGSAEGWHEYLGRLLKAADGRCWQELHQSTSPGRIRAYYGLVWFCKSLDLLEGMDDMGDQEVVVKLGASLKPWVMKNTLGRLPHVLQKVRAARLRVPPAFSQGAPPALSQVRKYGETVFAVSAVVWGTRSVYARGTFCRVLLHIAELAHGEEIWDDFTMGEIGKWTPDMNGNVEGLAAMGCMDARLRFGLSPLRVAREACMWGMVRKEHRRTLLNSTAVQVLNSITGFEPSGASSSPSAADGPHSFWPQPHEWVRDLAREEGTAKSETMYLCTVLYVLYASSTLLVRGGSGGGGSTVLYSAGCLDGLGFRREGPGHAL